MVFGMVSCSARRRIEICRSRITIHFYGFDVLLCGDGWWMTTYSGCICETVFWIFEFSHPLGDSAVRWSRVLVNIIQLLANFGSIQAFPGEKLDDWSILNFQHFWKMKTHGWQNVIFSYEGNEAIGPKLMYLTKNPSSIQWQKANVLEMLFEISCTNFPNNLIFSWNCHLQICCHWWCKYN